MSVSVKDQITTKTFRQLLTVQIVSTIVALAGTMIDGIIISRFLGPVNMAAYGLSTPATIIMIAFAFIFSSGASSVCGEYMGRGETKEVSRIMNKVLFAAVIVSTLFMAVLFFFPSQVSILLGAEGEIVQASADYLRTYSFSAYGFVLTPVLISFMQMDRDGKRALRQAIIFVICSTLLDLLNVLVLKWDMTGMGLTTSVSYFVAVGYLFLHFTKKDRSLSLSLKMISLKNLGSVFKQGLPSATYHVTNFVKVLSTNYIILAVGGTGGLFANTVLHSINPVVMGFITGTGSATLLLCSVIAGEGNRRSLHYTVKYILKIALCLGFVIGGAVFLLSGVCLSQFFCVDESAVYTDMVTTMFRFFSLSIPVNIINTAMINYYQSMKKLVLSNLICILDNAVYLVGIMLLFSSRFGVNGVWVSFASAEVLIFVTLFIYVWIHNKRFPRSVHDFLLYPEDFGVDENHRLNLTLTETSEVSSVFDQIRDFCMRQGIDEKKSVAAGHCFEELATISLSQKGKSKTYVDMYLTYQNQELRMRMRDNGIPLNMEELRKEDNPASVSMKILYGYASDVNYSVVLGLNVFTLVM